VAALVDLAVAAAASMVEAAVTAVVDTGKLNELG
jgi:hypothetical protein